MTREEILDAIRAHLADELDLYTLVQELEDSYGIRIPDEDAVQILSVGQAIDYILARFPGRPPGDPAEPPAPQPRP